MQLFFGFGGLFSNFLFVLGAAVHQSADVIAWISSFPGDETVVPKILVENRFEDDRGYSNRRNDAISIIQVIHVIDVKFEEGRTEPLLKLLLLKFLPPLPESGRWIRL